MDTDQNLLFGVLALQTDLLDNDRFAKACALWATDKDRALAEVLVEQGWLTPGDRADVEKLVQRKLQKHGGDARAGLTEAATPRVHESLAGLPDGAIRQSLAAATLASPGQVQTATTAEMPEVRDRYRLARLHATGGIGRVWLAHDDSLGRDVALKELRPEQARQPALWMRFLKEAQITGQLEHPGIVPIYELGRRPDDQAPYYTMRFVRGRTLAEAVASYHRRREQGQTGPLELRELLGAFVAVCNAAAYAHSRGVLHRDLKPHNVVLGDYGEAIVLDWGLARLTGQADDELPVAVRDLPTTAAGDATVQGQVLGTPAYMAPEQAEGRLDQLGPATDVYGLGAMLYEVLTGHPPFEGPETAAVLRQVIEQPPAAPRSVVFQVPRPLEAVCLKALAKRPSDRYASAMELAAEVQRWLADEPVLAYREPLTVRAARWQRHHRALVTGAAAAGLMALVGLGAVLWVQRRANADLWVAHGAAVEARERAEEQEGLAQAQRRRAEASYRLARTALADCMQLQDDPRFKQGPLEDVRRRLLQAEATFYQRFVELKGADEEFQAERAGAFRRLGDVTARLSSANEAIGHFQQALAIAEELVRTHPDDRKYQEVRASCSRDLGEAATSARQFPQAEAACRTALAGWEHLARVQPDAAEYRARVAECHGSLGRLYLQSGRLDEAVTAHRAAEAILGQLVQEHGGEEKYQSALARAHGNLGAVHRFQNRMPECHEQIQKGLTIYERLAHDHPDSVLYQESLGINYNNLGVNYHLTDCFAEAEAAHRRALAVRERLVRDHPAIPLYRYHLASSHNNLGAVSLDTARFAEAKAAFERALALREELVRAYPDYGHYAIYLAGDYGNLGSLAVTEGRFPDAVSWCGRAIASLTPLLKQGADPEGTEFLCNAHSDRADALSRLGRRDEALADCERAIELAPAGRRDEMRARRALAQARLGERAAALEAADALVRAKPRDGDTLFFLAQAYALGAPAADGHAGRALELLEQARESGFFKKPVNCYLLRNETNLDGLRGRPEFQKLLAELDEPARAKSR